jgi:protein-S-isoprenylcysteine O-methyltransferase Ste14
MNDERETAGVFAFPPLIFGGTLVLGIALGRGSRLAQARTRAAGIAIAAAGMLLGAAAIAEMKGTGTTISVYKPSSALATGGVFRWSRNPGYLGATAIYIGIALCTYSLPALALLPLALIVVERGVVEREERYLERRFADAYRTYRDAVPRWI